MWAAGCGECLCCRHRVRTMTDEMGRTRAGFVMPGLYSQIAGCLNKAQIRSQLLVLCPWRWSRLLICLSLRVLSM